MRQNQPAKSNKQNQNQNIAHVPAYVRVLPTSGAAGRTGSPAPPLPAPPPPVPPYPAAGNPSQRTVVRPAGPVVLRWPAAQGPGTAGGPRRGNVADPAR